MQAVENDIRDIKVGMLKHNEDDHKQFTSINSKLDVMHDTHIVNGENIKSILTQTTKTNGRVTSLEEYCNKLDKHYEILKLSNDNLCKIVSVQHNQYENYVKQREQVDKDDGNKYVTKESFSLVKKIVYGGSGIILATVLSSLLFLIIKTHV